MKETGWMATKMAPENRLMSLKSGTMDNGKKGKKMVKEK